MDAPEDSGFEWIVFRFVSWTTRLSMAQSRQPWTLPTKAISIAVVILRTDIVECFESRNGHEPLGWRRQLTPYPYCLYYFISISIRHLLTSHNTYFITVNSMLSPRPPKLPSELDLALEDGAKTPPRKSRARTAQSKSYSIDGKYEGLSFLTKAFKG